VALLLIVSLSGKFVAGYGYGPNDDQHLAVELSGRLAARGFATSIEPTLTGPVVHGTDRACRLTVRNGDNWPALSVVFQRRARPYGSLGYVYRGRISGAPPRIRPVFDRVAYRIGHVLGSAQRRPALLAVAASDGCDRLALARQLDGLTVAPTAKMPPNKLR